MAISMSTLRQSLSIAFFLWAVTYYLDKSYFKVALLIGISIMFHYSAAIVLVFLALVKKPLHSFVVIAGILGIGYLFFSDVVLFKIGRASCWSSVCQYV